MEPRWTSPTCSDRHAAGWWSCYLGTMQPSYVRVAAQVVLVWTVVVATSLAVGQALPGDPSEGPCASHFDDVVRRIAAGDRASGVDDAAAAATALARVAFEALEPAYPIVRRPGSWEDPHAAWLDARGWLPSSWREDRFDAEAWARMLLRLTEPYGADAPATGASDGEASIDALRTDVGAALRAGARAVRPLAVVARTPGRASTVDFAAVIWNWTPYPRLLLYGAVSGDVPEASDASLAPILASLGSCAWSPTAWVTGRADDVANFYLASSDTTLRIVATDLGPADLTFETVRASEAFRLTASGVEGASVASAVFSGPGPGLVRTIASVASLRSNLSVFGFGRYLQIP